MPHLADLLPDRVIYDRLTPAQRAAAYAAACLWYGFNGRQQEVRAS